MTGALKKIVPIVQKLLKADPGRKQDLMTPLAAAKKALDAEAYDDARKSVKTLIAAISTKPGAAPKAEPTADDTDLDEDELSDADDDVAKLLDPDVFVKLLRKSKREPDRIQAIADTSPAPAALGDVGELSDLAEAIDRLPAGARHVFVLHAVYGYSHEEAGNMLGIAAGTSKAQLHRARRLLAQQLKQQGFQA